MMQVPIVSQTALNELAASLSPSVADDVKQAVKKWVTAKEQGEKVVVITGSGPNLHEGVTTQLANMVAIGLVDGIITSSAVVGHELAGALERVRRVSGAELGYVAEHLPSDGRLEVALLSQEKWNKLAQDTLLDFDLHQRMLSLTGPEIIKVAGNLAYPTGLWIERLSREFLPLAQTYGLPLEAVMGLGCDARTMLGACARRQVPCLVSVPQLVGGGQVGLSIGDSISISRRSTLIAELLASAELIVESGVALTQEIHDGPLDLFTGHGLWAHFDGRRTFSLKDKSIVRIDLDGQIKKVWELQRQQNLVAATINQGKPKALTMNVPFRMEMSGFARIPGSLPLTGDIGIIWPILASCVAQDLGQHLDFTCYKQGTPLGEEIRNYIADQVGAFDKVNALTLLRERKAWN